MVDANPVARDDVIVWDKRVGNINEPKPEVFMPAARRFVFSLFVAGALVAGIFLLCRSPEPQVQAQPPAKELSPGPYQISSWAVWATTPPGGMGEQMPNRLFRGAYIIDSKTGDVFSVNGDEKPKLIGSVKKKE